MALGLAIGGLTAGPGCQPFVVRKTARIGFVTGESEDSPIAVTHQNLDAFRTAMRPFNWIDGQNLTIDVRYAEANIDRLQALAGELASLPVDVIVGNGVPVNVALHAAKLSTPVVMIGLVEPVAAGVVDSLARLGGNITGMTGYTTGLVTSKVVGLLHGAIPGLTRLAVLENPLSPSPPLSTIVSLIQESASSLGIQTQLVDVRSANDFESAFVQTAAWQAQAMYVINDGGTVIGASYARVADLAVRYRLPTITAGAGRSFPQAGGLMSYASDVRVQFERAAYFVDRILRGASPADLPIEQPNAYEFVVNARTAQSLGLTLPDDVAAQVTDWIQ